MHIMPIKGFPHAKLGYLAKGSVVEVSDDEGARLIRMGHANPAAAPIYATKVIQPQPTVGELPGMADGAERLSSASPAAQASPQTTSSESASGGKKKGRKTRGE